MGNITMAALAVAVVGVGLCGVVVLIWNAFWGQEESEE